MPLTPSDSAKRTAFDDLPESQRLRVFGVDYARLYPPEGGELLVTRLGWPFVQELMPDMWYPNQKMSLRSIRLTGATGTVYRVPGRPRRGRPVDLVVKFSRFAQELPIHCGSTFPEHVWLQLIATARFNSPFEEFGVLQRLRQTNARFPFMLTKRPLAIYSPERRFSPWELGRSNNEFDSCRHRVESDQPADSDHRATLEADRDYILLFGWVDGLDAEQVFQRGAISEHDLHALSLRIARDLHRRGFHVLDNKPKHFILRTSRRNGELLRRNGELAYALIDFELLVDAVDPAIHDALLRAMERTYERAATPHR